MYHPAFTSRKEHAKALMKRSGYRTGGKVDEAASDVHKHEKHLHKGEPMTKLATGGAVEGFASGGRLDKMARGGRSKKPNTKITIINAPQGGPSPQPVNPMMAHPMAPPMPAPPPPGMGGMPPQMMPMRKQGGPVPKMTAGAASGPGRMEKVEEYGGTKKKVR